MTDIIPRELIKHLEWDPGKQKPKKKEPVSKSVEQKTFSIDALVRNGKPFYSDKKDGKGKWIGVTESLQQTLDYISFGGVVASMPYLIAGKAQADKNNYLWKDWFTALTEENAGIDTKGIFVAKNKPVVVTVHGGGILTLDRIKQAYDEGLTPQNAAKYTDEEFDNLLNGVLPSGEKIKLYTLDVVTKGNISNPFGRYAVVMDFETAKATESGYYKKKEFMENPLIIARAGTLEYLETYFDKAKHSRDQDVRNSHRLNKIDFNQPQGRLLFLNYDYFGLSGGNDLDINGRFVGVAPEARRAKK